MHLRDAKLDKLWLNEPTLHYKEFYGRNTKQMPLLIAEGRTPISVAELMERKLKAFELYNKILRKPEDYPEEYKEDVIKFYKSWMDHPIYTGDVVASHPNGRIKLVLDSQPLREINPQSRLKGGALVLPDGLFEKLDGLDLKEQEVVKYAGGGFSREMAKSDPLWQFLARDQNLLNDYVDFIFAEIKQRFGDDKLYVGFKDRNMGIYIASSQDVPTMRLWFVYGPAGWSIAEGRGGLDDSFGRLVGKVPKPTLEEKVQ